MDRARNWWHGIDLQQQHLQALTGSIAAAELDLKELGEQITTKQAQLDILANSANETEYMAAELSLSGLRQQMAAKMQHVAFLQDQRNAMVQVNQQRQQAATVQQTASYLQDHKRSGVAKQLVGGMKSAYSSMDYVQGADNAAYQVRNDSKTHRNMVQARMAARRRQMQNRVASEGVGQMDYTALARYQQSMQGGAERQASQSKN